MEYRRTQVIAVSVMAIVNAFMWNAQATDPCGGIEPGVITGAKRWAYVNPNDSTKTESLYFELSGPSDYDSMDSSTCIEGVSKSPNMVDLDATLWSTDSGSVDPPDGHYTNWTPRERGDGYHVRATVADDPNQYYDDPNAVVSKTVGAYEVYVLQNLQAAGAGAPQVTNPLLYEYASQDGFCWAGFNDFGSGAACSSVKGGGTGAEDYCAGTATASWYFGVMPANADTYGGYIRADQMILTGGSQWIGVDDADLDDGASNLSFSFALGYGPINFAITVTPYFDDCDEGMGLTSWGYAVDGGTVGVPQNPDQHVFQKRSGTLDDPLTESCPCALMYAFDPVGWFWFTEFEENFAFNTGASTNSKMPNTSIQAQVITYAYADSSKNQTHGNGYACALIHDWSAFAFLDDVEFVAAP